MMAVGSEFDVVDVGYLHPNGMAPADALSAGEVGYLTASIKNVRDVRVGDTVTASEGGADEPLPGYKEVKSMVYSGIYPADGARYDDLREALEKLKLNDASLNFEAETSVALGFGFRCGFLGLLHMEIVQERLEREFNIDLVTTAPSVEYRVIKTDGSVLTIDNPTNLPEPSEIDYMEEPIVRAGILSPKEYVGSIMELCQDRRGTYIDMEYLDVNRVQLNYFLPLNEIIYDFFDALKSRTRGYASFDYEFERYERSNLVKLDMLLNGEMVDALSFIVHADRAYPRGRKMAEKLKEVIPRYLYRRLWAGRLSPERRSRLCARTCLQSATAVIYQESASCLKSRKRARSACVRWAALRSRRKRLCRCSNLTSRWSYVRCIYTHTVLQTQVRLLRF